MRKYTRRSESEEREVSSKRKVKRKVRPGCLITILALLLSAAVLLLTPAFDIKRIEVKGNRTVGEDIIKHESGITTNMNIFRANTKKAEKNIRAHEFVEDVKVKRVLPGTIRIVVTEGEVAAYIDSPNYLVGISIEGKTLCLVSDKALRDMDKLVLYGMTITKSINGEVVEVAEKKKLEEALRMMDSFSEMGMLDKITAINMKASDDVDLRYANKLKIEFGSFDNYEYKMQWLENMIRNVLGEEPEGLVNMHNTENITYRPSIE